MVSCRRLLAFRLADLGADFCPAGAGFSWAARAFPPRLPEACWWLPCAILFGFAQQTAMVPFWLTSPASPPLRSAHLISHSAAIGPAPSRKARAHTALRSVLPQKAAWRFAFRRSPEVGPKARPVEQYHLLRPYTCAQFRFARRRPALYLPARLCGSPTADQLPSRNPGSPEHKPSRSPSSWSPPWPPAALTPPGTPRLALPRGSRHRRNRRSS